MMAERLTDSGIAIPVDASKMLDQICTHFVEHASVVREGNLVTIESQAGKAEIRMVEGRLAIQLSCPSDARLQLVRSVLAEHLFMFAGGEPLELSWHGARQASVLPNFREIGVVGARTITPHMRRVTVACEDVEQFCDGGLHVRLLIPPKGRRPVWPHMRSDGRIQWPEGDDALAVRIYTIRGIDRSRREMDIDFVLHEGEGMPGATWAVNARPGDVAGLIGPGGGGVPNASNLLLAGDETALPAMARIAAEVPAGTKLRILIEVDGPEEQQPLPSAGDLQIDWLHRNGAPAGTTKLLQKAVKTAASAAVPGSFLWVGCEKATAATIRDFVRNELKYDRRQSSIAAYWER